MSSGRLEGRRVLVVGASAGIGRASGLAVAREGARVAFSARRVEALAEAAATAGTGCVAVPCDVCDPQSCEDVVREAAAALGGLDGVVYTPGITALVAVENADAEVWRSTFETNLFGAQLVTRAALPFLLESRGKVVFISSIVIDDRPPRVGMAPYVASKVALETLAQAWQGEHPTVGFTTIAVGDTLTEKVGQSPGEDVEKFVRAWLAAGIMPGRLMDADAVAEQVVNALASRENVRRIALTPVPPEQPAAVEIPGYAEEA